MTRLRTDEFRGYIWLRWFSTTMLLIWPVFAIRLAGTGLEESAGREYLLSLPATRRRIAILASDRQRRTDRGDHDRAVAAGLRDGAAPGPALSGQDALIHSVILMVGGLGLFGLTMFLRVMTTGRRGLRGDGRG